METANLIALFLAVSGALSLWSGVRYHSRSSVGLGLMLQCAGGYYFLAEVFYPFSAIVFGNLYFASCLVISLCGFSGGYLLTRSGDGETAAQRYLAPLLMVWGMCWFWLGGVRETVHHQMIIGSYNVLLLYFCTATILMTIAARRGPWPLLGLAQMVLLPLIYGCMLWGLASVAGVYHLFGLTGCAAWLVALFTQYRLLHYYEDAWPAVLTGCWHAATMWLIAIVTGHELAWLGRVVSGSEVLVAILAIVPSAALMLLVFISKRSERWPMGRFRLYYVRGVFFLPVLVVLIDSLNWL